MITKIKPQKNHRKIVAWCSRENYHTKGGGTDTGKLSYEGRGETDTGKLSYKGRGGGTDTGKLSYKERTRKYCMRKFQMMTGKVTVRKFYGEIDILKKIT